MNTSVTQGCAQTGRSDILKPGARLRLFIVLLLFTMGRSREAEDGFAAAIALRRQAAAEFPKQTSTPF